MSPALRAENIPPTRGAFVESDREPSPGEVRIWCPVDDDCEWTTIRPEHAAASCRQAHTIEHDKGWR